MNHLSAEELQTLLQHGRYSIENFDTLKRVLSDAFTLYDIMAGKSRLSDLLTTIEKKADPEAFSLVIFDLARFLRPRLQKAVAEILELQQDHATTLADSFAPILEYRLAAMQAVKQRIRNLWAEAGITDTAGLQVVDSEICQQIRSDVAALGRIERGDFSDVDRFFRERLSVPKGLIQ